MVKPAVTVVGAGNAGQAMAGDLALGGADVCLYELPEFERNLEPLRKQGGIEVTGIGRTGLAKVKPTSDIGEAMAHGELVFIVTQALAHDALAASIVPHFRDGQAVVVFTS